MKFVDDDDDDEQFEWRLCNQSLIVLLTGKIIISWC